MLGSLPFPEQDQPPHKLDAFDAANRLLSKTPDASFNAPAVTYDKVGNRLQQTGPHKPSSWRWRQKRFTRRLDKMLLDQVGAEELAKVLRPMGTDLDRWLRACE